MLQKRLLCLTTIIILLIGEVKSERSDKWMDVFIDITSVYRYYLSPCDLSESENTANNLFEAGELPRHTQNPYLILIHHEFPISKVDVTLGSAGTVYFFHGTPYKTAEVSNYTLTNTFSDEITVLSFLIERSKPSTIPHVSSLEINGIKLCKDPNKVNLSADGGHGEGTHDRFIERFREFESVSLPVTDSFCGKRKVDQTQLIVNGFPTKPGDWPWHTALYKIIQATSSYICGGTLISNFYVLTAAHCVTYNGSPLLPELLSVVLGKYNLRGWDITAIEKEVHEIKVHDSFNPKELNNDIALLKLATKVEYDNYIQPACLWQSGLNYKLPKRVLGTVVGWGIDHTDQLSSQLQQVQIPMVKEINCLKSNRLFFGRRLDDNNFCAGYRNGTSACNGDSGGGFTISIDGRYYIRGIVSSAVPRPNEPKCDPTQYVLFTDVEKYVSWIQINIK